MAYGKKQSRKGVPIIIQTCGVVEIPRLAPASARLPQGCHLLTLATLNY